MAKKSTLGKLALIKSINRIGIVTKTNASGDPVEVTVDGEIINVVKLSVQIYSMLKTLFYIIKNWFKK